MSAHMKRHHTSSKATHNTAILYVVDRELLYAIPKKVAKKYIVTPNKTVDVKENISIEAVFNETDQKYGEAAVLLRGLRARENLTQMEFAKRIQVSQANLSKMENGTRAIGKTIAMRIAKAFKVNYKYFL